MLPPATRILLPGPIDLDVNRGSASGELIVEGQSRPHGEDIISVVVHGTFGPL